MTPETFFVGRLTGVGCVQGLGGRVLRRYTVQIAGAWSEEHRALHVDETYTYVGGAEGTFKRSWAAHTDEEGFIVGYDANQAARFRGRERGGDLRVVFDRPVRPGGRLEPKQIVHLIEVGPTQVMMIGRMVLFGLTIATTHTALRRVG